MTKEFFNDDELLRYSRHIFLPEVDVDGQLAISNATVLIVGVGGLGSAAAQYLAASGVGELILVDHDNVDLSNLQRQVIHKESTLNRPKVTSAEAAIHELNSTIKVDAVFERIDEEALAPLVKRADVVLDCTDNFEIRQTINRVCVVTKKPLVSGAAIRFEGQISVFDLRKSSSPCYQCLFGLLDQEGLTCSQSGVFSPVVGIIGTFQALEALKIIANIGEGLAGRVLLFNALQSRWREFKLQRDDACVVCVDH